MTGGPTARQSISMMRLTVFKLVFSVSRLGSRDYRCHGRSAAVKAMARPSVQLRKGVLNVGSDCSGLGTDVLCLRKMLKDSKAVLQHRFSSDTNVHCRAVLESLGLRPSERMQDPSAVPAVDLYSCGFPCQPYSLLE